MISETAYYPFGRPRYQQATDGKGSFYTYTGKELDQTGLFYYEARYMDPVIGRFISVDPLMHSIGNALECDEDGTVIDTIYNRLFNRIVSNPAELNFYTYSLNNPILYNDPTGLVTPVDGQNVITSPYGERNIPQSDNDFHHGVDIRAREVTPVRAVQDGVVVASGPARGGTRVIIRHTDGSYTWSRHINPTVSQGDRVNEGDIIGHTCTGVACGTGEPHLHFERAEPGEGPSNPAAFIEGEQE